MQDINVWYKGESLRVEYIDGEDFHGRWTPEIETIYNEEGKNIMDEIGELDDIYDLIEESMYNEANEIKIEKEVRRFEDRKELKYRGL